MKTFYLVTPTPCQCYIYTLSLDLAVSTAATPHPCNDVIRRYFPYIFSSQDVMWILLRDQRSNCLNQTIKASDCIYRTVALVSLEIKKK